MTITPRNSWNWQPVALRRTDTTPVTAKPSSPSSGSSGSSHNYGGNMLLKEGEVAPNMYATAQPTVAPTVAPTAQPTAAPVYDTPTQAPKTKQSQKSPAPVAGLIAGLGIAALVLARLRR